MQNNGTVDFTIGGKRVSLSKKAVESALRNVEPEPIRKYSVQVGDSEYPIKQVVSVASGIPIAAFISTDAYRILTRLGFEVRV